MATQIGQLCLLVTKMQLETKKLKLANGGTAHVGCGISCLQVFWGAALLSQYWRCHSGIFPAFRSSDL